MHPPAAVTVDPVSFAFVLPHFSLDFFSFRRINSLLDFRKASLFRIPKSVFPRTKLRALSRPAHSQQNEIAVSPVAMLVISFATRRFGFAFAG